MFYGPKFKKFAKHSSRAVFLNPNVSADQKKIQYFLQTIIFIEKLIFSTSCNF
jgi:hypothetical protein